MLTIPKGRVILVYEEKNFIENLEYAFNHYPNELFNEIVITLNHNMIKPLSKKELNRGMWVRKLLSKKSKIKLKEQNKKLIDKVIQDFKRMTNEVEKKSRVKLNSKVIKVDDNTLIMDLGNLKKVKLNK